MFSAPPLIIYMTAEPFEYPRSDWPSNVRLVGPCAWDPPAEPPEWLDEVDAPLVLVTTSSEFQADGRLVECALAAFAGEDVHVVVTLPSIDPSGFDPPPNARVLSFVPHGPLLDRAAAVITHGGDGRYAERTRAGRACLCSSIRTRPAGGCPSRRGCRCWDACPGKEAAPRQVAHYNVPGDGAPQGCAKDRPGLP